MASESLSRLPIESGAEDDYRSFCDALSSTTRGRAFLEEFSRRNRQADTEVVLAALNRLEETALSHAATSPEAERIRQDLRALLDTLRTARPQTENSPTAIKAATLAALIDFAQARIEALVMMPTPAGEAEMLAAVPALEQPELPIPHPAATAAPMMALVNAPSRPEPTSAAPSFATPQARRKPAANVIPIVEFDYRAHQAVRPAPVRSSPEEAWATLTPPTISAPAYAAPLPASPVVAEPEPASPAAAPAQPVEAYELWLDAPAAAEPELPARADMQTAPVLTDPAPWTEAAAPEPAATMEPVQESTAPDVIMSHDVIMPEAMLAETMLAETAIAEIAVAETAMSDIAVTDVADTAQPDEDSPQILDAGAAMVAIAALMQQMEKAAAPASKGHAEGPDPLAPLMALSEEERIALFT